MYGEKLLVENVMLYSGWNWLKRNSVNKHEKQRMNNVVFEQKIYVSQKRVIFGQKYVICVKQRVILWYTDTLIGIVHNYYLQLFDLDADVTKTIIVRV